MINCFILGDEITIRTLTHHINQLSIPLSGSSTSFTEGFNHIINHKPDLVYIEMSYLQRYEEELDVLKRASSFVVLSENPADALAAFEFQAFDYLLKPLKYSRVVKSIDKYHAMVAKVPRDNWQEQYFDSFFVKTDSKGSRQVLVRYQDIVYVEALQNYVLIHLDDGLRHTIFNSLKDMEDSLPMSFFTRIHKSFIVNDQKIKVIEGNNVVLSGVFEQQLMIGSTYKKKFFEKKGRRIVKASKLKVSDHVVLFVLASTILCAETGFISMLDFF